MKKNSLSKRLIRTKENGSSTKYLEYKKGVFIRLIEIDGFARVMIELASDTTGDELKAIIPDALNWRDTLDEVQLPLLRGGKSPFLAFLDDAHKAGASYRKLAESINQQLAKQLVEAGQDKYMLVFVYSTLLSMGFGYDEIDNIVDAGLQNIKNNLPPFDDVEYPIQRNKIRSVLVWWRKKVENIKAPYKIRSLVPPREQMDT